MGRDLSERRDEEKRFIVANDTSRVDPGEYFHLVAIGWVEAWKAFVRGTKDIPGPIDNEVLLSSRGEPLPGLKPAKDYRGVNAKVWQFWISRYGGGPEIRRSTLDIYAPGPKPSSVSSLSRRATAERPMEKSSSLGRSSVVSSAERERDRGGTMVPGKPKPSGGLLARFAPTTRKEVLLERDPPYVNGNGTTICDKCDGRHPTERCPHYRKQRDKHQDAWANYGKAGDESLARRYSVKSATVVRQPGDGSCLFHSLAHGLGNAQAQTLRLELANFIAKNPDLLVADSPLSDWIQWESGQNVRDYARRMKGQGEWGGAVEMAACSHAYRCNVHVYEKTGEGFERISSFDYPGASRTVNILYGGRVHYDALTLSN